MVKTWRKAWSCLSFQAATVSSSERFACWLLKILGGDGNWATPAVVHTYCKYVYIIHKYIYIYIILILIYIILLLHIPVAMLPYIAILPVCNKDNCNHNLFTTPHYQRLNVFWQIGHVEFGACRIEALELGTWSQWSHRMSHQNDQSRFSQSLSEPSQNLLRSFQKYVQIRDALVTLVDSLQSWVRKSNKCGSLDMSWHCKKQSIAIPST